MVQPAPNTEALDGYINNLVQTLQSAVGQAMRRLEDDPQAVDKTLLDCQEILDFVLEGNVEEWVS